MKRKNNKKEVTNYSKSNLDQTIENLEKTLLKCDTDGGSVHIDWEEDSPVTPLGQFVFFAHFLKTCGLFQDFVDTCPDWCEGPIPKTVKQQMTTNLLGTYLLSTLAGHKRYAHVTAIRYDKVNPPLLGMTKIYSEDVVRRAFKKVDPQAAESWLQK